MSIVSTITGIAGRVDLAASLLGIGGDAPLILGGIEFADMEIPETLLWGGSQSLKVHKLPGGVRVIDAMGRDDASISWSGIFINDADTRARAIDELRIAGEEVSLSWRDFSLTVVVRTFSCNTKAFHSPYSITCEVLRDDTASEKNSNPSLLQQIGADINSAVGFDLTGNVATAVATAQQAVQAANKVAGVAVALTGGNPALVSMQSAIGTAVAVTGAAVSAAGATISASQILATINPDLAVAAASATTTAAGIAAQASAAGSYLSRAAASLAPVTTSAIVKFTSINYT